MNDAPTAPQTDPGRRLRAQRSEDAIIAQYILDARTPVNRTEGHRAAAFWPVDPAGTLVQG